MADCDQKRDGGAAALRKQTGAFLVKHSGRTAPRMRLRFSWHNRPFPYSDLAVFTPQNYPFPDFLSVQQNLKINGGSEK